MSTLGIVIEDVSSIRKDLEKLLRQAGCDEVIPMQDSDKLIPRLEQEPDTRTVILISDLMDSKKAAARRNPDQVISVAQKRVNDLRRAQDVQRRIKVIVYSMAPTLADSAATLGEVKAERYERFVARLKKELELEDENLVGKLEPTFDESQQKISERVEALLENAEKESR